MLRPSHPRWLTGGAAGPSSRRSAAITAVHCTSSAPQSTSCCVRRASSSALSSSAPLSTAGRAAPAGRAVAGPAAGAAAAEGAGGRADRSGAGPAVDVLPASLPSESGGTRLPVLCVSAAVPGRLLGLAGRLCLAAVVTGAAPAAPPLPVLCCSALGSLRGDHLPPPAAPPFRLPLPSTCSAGCCSWEGSAGPCRAPAAGATGGSAAAGSVPGAALLMLRRPSLPPLTLPPVLPLLAAGCNTGWEPAWEPWLLRPGACAGRWGWVAALEVPPAGFQLPGAPSPASLPERGGRGAGRDAPGCAGFARYACRALADVELKH